MIITQWTAFEGDQIEAPLAKYYPITWPTVVRRDGFGAVHEDVFTLLVRIDTRGRRSRRLRRAVRAARRGDFAAVDRHLHHDRLL